MIRVYDFDGLFLRWRNINNTRTSAMCTGIWNNKIIIGMIVGMIVAVTERDSKLLSFTHEHANYEDAVLISLSTYRSWLFALKKDLEKGQITISYGDNIGVVYLHNDSDQVILGNHLII